MGNLLNPENTDFGIDYSQCFCGNYTPTDDFTTAEIMSYASFIEIFDCVPAPRWIGKKIRVYTCSVCGSFLKLEKI